MALKVAKTIRFSKSEVAEVERIADEEGLTFSQIISKLTALGMAEFKQSRRYSLRALSSTPEGMSITERRRTNLIIQNTLMLEQLVKRVSSDNYQDIVRCVREKSREILREDFMVPAPTARE